MNEKQSYKNFILSLVSLLIWAAMIAGWVIAWELCYADFISRRFWTKGNLLVHSVYALVLFLFNRVYGGYRVGTSRPGDLIFSGTLSVIFTNLFIWIQTSLLTAKVVSIVPLFYLTLIDFVLLCVWAPFANKVFERFFPPHRMLLVYEDHNSAESLIYKMATRAEKYDICAVLHVREGTEEICKRSDDFESVILCDLPAAIRNEILKYCYKRSKRVYLTPSISDVIVRGGREVNLFDTPLLVHRNTGLTVQRRIVKRAIDLVFAVLGIIVTAPVMAALAIAIKSGDGGPVIYKQKRLTCGARQFDLYKFRSMIVGAEKNGAQLSSKHDERITPVGRFMRKVRMDELPQLFNILKGDMSLVGPRPERPEIARKYERSMPEFSFRLKVKAGLTGYAQVMGQYNTTPYDKLKMDLTYIENYSVLMDIRLILTTLKIIFFSQSTEGIEDGQTTAMYPVGSPLKEVGDMHRREGAPPLVSVVVPAYNSAPTIEESIQSALAQTVDNIEVIVVDDGSTDGTPELVRALAAADERVTLLENQRNGGVGFSRNRGIAAAKGRYIALLDADDLWRADKLQRQLSVMDGADICATSYSFVDWRGHTVRRPYLVPSQITYKQLLKENFIGNSTVLIKRDILPEEPFKPDFFHEDYVLWLHLLRGGAKAVGLREILTVYRTGGRSADKVNAAKNRWRVYRKAERLSLLVSVFCFMAYMVSGIKKHLF
ncbi:MAG: exopolysaccharide biosynthesis polyprenyl glycosylphosphotransferase [Christensenellales bacterium]|jgi:exopolysaccharide biosynthesis polyprenyl glycosylphosphotransferase